MNPNTLLFPVMALSGWTLLVLLLVPFHRFRAGFNGRVKIEDFRFGESARVPGDVSIPNRNFMNLLEVPVLFYVLCLMAYISHSSLSPALAWTYVGLRLLHSLIHLSYNDVIHRLSIYATSNFVLAALWIQLLLALSR